MSRRRQQDRGESPWPSKASSSSVIEAFENEDDEDDFRRKEYLYG